MSPQQEERFLRRVAKERLTSHGEAFFLPIHLDLTSAVELVGNLQLALRHPENRGHAAQMARQMIDGIIQKVKEAGFDAHAELMLLGDDPTYDEPRRPS
jgi:hypothetical protein